jgi:two-component system sensor kinase FixL
MASIAHEIKQPLAAIHMNADEGLHLLSMEARAIEKVDLREILGDVRDDSGRAADIIERLRALASKRPLELVALDVNDVVNEILRLVAADARRRDVKLHAELGTSLPAVAADRVCLQQVLWNLIVNAMDAMEHAGTNDRQVIVHTRRFEEDVEIVVCDTGPGIAVDSLPKLFSAFFTTKDNSMGLGLAIARSIVASHGGRLWAEAPGGRGATFHVTLPVLISA